MNRTLGFFPVLLLATAASLSGQARLGAISGAVRDTSGAPQMGATIELLANQAAAAIVVYTDSRGHYSVNNLPAGRYQIRASSASFLPTLRENVSLRSGASVVVNLTLNTLFEALQIMPVRSRTPED